MHRFQRLAATIHGVDVIVVVEHRYVVVLGQRCMKQRRKVQHLDVIALASLDFVVRLEARHKHHRPCIALPSFSVAKLALTSFSTNSRIISRRCVAAHSVFEPWQPHASSHTTAANVSVLFEQVDHVSSQRVRCAHCD